MTTIRLVFVTSSYQKAFTGSSTLLSNLLLSSAMPITHTELHVHVRDQIRDTCIGCAEVEDFIGIGDGSRIELLYLHIN